MGSITKAYKAMVETTAISIELTPSVRLVRPSSEAGARNGRSLVIWVGTEHIAFAPDRFD